MTFSSPMAKCLMIQGTGSGVGKSILTAAFCRRFYMDGWKTAPFKAQNMSLNSFITEDGGEIGRAQAYQAEACGIAPSVSMNPVLLKPCADNQSQVIIMGKAIATYDAKNYYKSKPRFYDEVLTALNDLRTHYEVVVLEGAGSPAEINLRENDFVNMPMAKAAEAPVIIVGDIDKGGVFAWMKGTYDLLTPDEQNHVTGFIINKFRGDIDILKPGIIMFEEMVGKPVLGVIPFYRDLFVDEEDAIPEMISPSNHNCKGMLDVAIIRLPRISNFTDFSPLILDPAVSVRYIWRPSQIGNPDILIIPGTKNTLDDMQFIKNQGLDREIINCHERGTVILGICGGLQILGKTISDPQHLESQESEITGLGLLDLETTLDPDKVTRQTTHVTRQSPLFAPGLNVKGYEIHMGRTKYNGAHKAIFADETYPDAGVISFDGRIIATYLHGFLDNDQFRLQFLNHARKQRGIETETNTLDYSQLRNEQLDKLAKIIDDHIDMKKIYALMELQNVKVS